MIKLLSSSTGGLNNYTSSSAKCSNTAYGAKPSRTTNHLIDDATNILIKLFVKWLKNMMKERI